MTGPFPTLLLAAALLAAAACDSAPGDRDPADRAPGADSAAPAAGGADDPADRPVEVVDTIHLEGMPEPMSLRLFRTGPGFPLPFSAYVPADMRAEATDPAADGSASVHIFAEFDGRRNAGAFLHLFVFPEGTARAAAIATARAYEVSRGVPVSQGIEPLGEEEATRRFPWALASYRFRYQGTGGEPIVGSIAVGERGGRLFQLVTHYPAEFGDGFGPRSALVKETWRWADGTALGQNPVPRPSP